jgi:hypothetical protein
VLMQLFSLFLLLTHHRGVGYFTFLGLSSGAKRVDHLIFLPTLNFFLFDINEIPCCYYFYF